MPTTNSATLSLALLVAQYFNALCTTSPHQPRSTPYATDTISYLVTTPSTLATHASTLATLYQALVTLFSTASPADRALIARICPYPQHFDAKRVSWNSRTVGFLALLALGAAIRLSAYGGLGRNFTFQLATPDRLITSGVYRYLQHPSYTGLVLVSLAYAGLVAGRLDTPVACWIPPVLLEVLREWQVPLGVLGTTVGLAVLGVRICDEERMLREKFGAEWERWHRRTARLIPFVF
ncbi:hypothetical protein BJY01DRAFT_16708 [Aspergillus pseudoustus]|uniref:Protein-S-isoprenylcysteine O-methyltransferase n=1 Tax=Aspergillus pseudoustus TaxID=1810923 RepID=A0ABR4JKT7_9EURO